MGSPILFALAFGLNWFKRKLICHKSVEPWKGLMGKSDFIQGIKDFLYGFFLHGMVSGTYQKKAELEDVFMLFTLGEAIGVPVFSGFYHLRLVPYYAARFHRWKEKTLKPRDLFDIVRD